MCLTSMGELRDTPHFSFKGEMDYAIGNAVKAMGPSLVLEAIPLGITGENDNLEFPRGWLLPLLRDNVTHTELHFFASYFLPLAAKFKIKADQLSKERRIAESKIYDTLHFQIWSLLKGFCDHPTDITKSFQAVAKTLGTALSEREDLQMDIMAALRSLISCCIENEADKKEIGRFAKNYLPILFNLFTDENTSNDGIRLAALETIKKYLLVTDEKLILTFLDKCLHKMNLDAKGFRNLKQAPMTFQGESPIWRNSLVVAHYTDGLLVAHYTDGLLVAHYTDGLLVAHYTDGLLVAHYTDGLLVAHYTDGLLVAHYTDGLLVAHYTDGLLVAHYTDGLLVAHYTDGLLVTHYT
ncbi:pre-rRNA processing protein [Bulinus truncatus]|nr:pre-rRNA processing protein [Bulinus truncatus]